MADLKVQQKAAGAVKVSPFRMLGSYFSSVPLPVVNKGELKLQVFHKEHDVTKNMSPLMKFWYELNSSAIKAGFDVLYRNHGETLEKRFITLNHIIAKKAFKSILLLIVTSPVSISLAIIYALMDLKTPKEKLMKSSTAQLVMEARKAQEISTFTPKTAVEEKLSTIVYETSEDSHIKIHWPAEQFLPESDPNRDLWHICPAGVYHAEKDIMGMMRPVVDYENCVKCESCWLGSSLVDWGRRGNHRLQYRVKTTATSTLLRHQSVESETFPLGESSLCNSPLDIDQSLLVNLKVITLDIIRLQELIVSSKRSFNASERQFIKTLHQTISDQLNIVCSDKFNERTKSLLESLMRSCKRIAEFISSQRYYWIEAELQVMQQHALVQLGLQPHRVQHTPVLSQKEDQATAHFSIARLHKINKNGLQPEDLLILNNYLARAKETDGIEEISELAKIDLGLAALFINRHLCSSIDNSVPAALLIAEDLEIDAEGLLSAEIPFALSAGADMWIVVSEQGCWSVSRSAQGLQSASVGSIGLRLAKVKKITLSKVKATKLPHSGLSELRRDGIELFTQAVTSAGEYLLHKSIDHSTSRIQFPDLFQDAQGRDGIIKFGAVKSLIAHIAARLECLKSAANKQLPADILYVQAGKWLGTQEGSFTYNATQVYGGTGFSEDDRLSPYYRDASIFKYLLGDPYAIQVKSELHDCFYKNSTLPQINILPEVNFWLDKALAADRQIAPSENDLTFRAEMDFMFIRSTLQSFQEKMHKGENLLYYQQVLQLLARIYWNSANARLLDSQSVESRRQCAQSLLTENWRHNKPMNRTFDYDVFLNKLTPTATGSFLSEADFTRPRYSPEHLLCDEKLSAKSAELNKEFKEKFIDSDFEGMSYVRYAEAQHGQSNEIIKMFHDKGWMRLIIPSELGGGGCLKADYYLLISASMQYGDPALSLLIQASTSIGTSPMLLAWKKDLPQAIKDVEALQKEEKKILAWVTDCRNLIEMLKNPDPKKIHSQFEQLGNEVKAFTKQNAAFKSQAMPFLMNLHKAGQAGLSFELDKMAQLLNAGADSLEKLPAKISPLAEEFRHRKDGVGFFLSLIASGQTSAFALTEPSAGSDTARVATRAEIKEIELKIVDDLYTFEIEGKAKILIAPEQRRFHDRKLQIRPSENEPWCDVSYEEYSWENDTGCRYFLRDTQKVYFHEFGRPIKKDAQFVYRHYELTGSKMWITNGRFAGLFALYAKTKEGITGMCVDRYAEGLTVGKDEEKMGQNASPTNELFLEKVRVCTTFVLGMEGRGQVNALETLNVGRAGLSLSSLALSEDVLEAALKHSKGSPEDLVLIGRMAEEIFGALPAAYEMISTFDSHGDARMESAIGKFMNSEILHRCILYSEGIHGACSQTYLHDVEKKKRDARILNIYEGTNEIQRFLILKDLMEILSKKDVKRMPSQDDANLQKWDELRLLLFEKLKTVRKDIASKSWMDAQLQAVFFSLSEIAGWLKFTEGSIWRLLDWEPNVPVYMRAALEGAIKRGFAEINTLFTKFNWDYERLSRGIRPPEIQLTDFLLDKLAAEAESYTLPAHCQQSKINVAACLYIQPLNKPEPQISNQQLHEDCAVLSSGSRVVFDALCSLPQECNKEIFIAAPANAAGLIQHLSSFADVTWLSTGEQWPVASEATKYFSQHIKHKTLLLLDGSNHENLASAANLCAMLKFQPYEVNEFCLANNKLSIQNSGGITSCDCDQALILSSHFKQRPQSAQTQAGKIRRIHIEVTAASSITLPPPATQKAELCVNSPDSAANYLNEKLGLKNTSGIYSYHESNKILTADHMLLGSLRDGEFTKDTQMALNHLLEIYPDLLLIIAASEGVELSCLDSLEKLPRKVIFADYPELWLRDIRLSTRALTPLFEEYSNTQLFFSSSRAAEGGAIAADRVLQCGVYQASADSLHFLQADGHIICETQTNAQAVKIMAPAPAQNDSSSKNQTTLYRRWKLTLGDDFQNIKQMLEESTHKLNIDSISDADFIVDIGYGIGNQDNYDEYILPLLETLKNMGVKASIGASRKLVETLKILPAETQIGQSGSSVAPTILIAIGISGAPQHLNYIERNTVILAFNIDPKAPIMTHNESQPSPKVYPVVGKLQKTLPALQNALEGLTMEKVN